MAASSGLLGVSLNRGSFLNANYLACVAACLVFSAASPAAPFAPPRPAVVELFTSEGCSSCPPAEEVLAQLSARTDVLALAFHVDYWDSLGWADRFAIPAAVARQDGYARLLARPSVYTPQLVIDGRADFVGSDRGRIEAALQGVRTGIPVKIAIAGGTVAVGLGGGQCLSPSDILFVTYSRRAVSAIGRGENAGRTLTEYNIVRSLRTLGRWDGSAQSLAVMLASVPAEATDVAVIVQSPEHGQIIGAASQALR